MADIVDEKGRILRTDENGREYYEYPKYPGFTRWADKGRGAFRTPPDDRPVLRDPVGMVRRRNEISRQRAIEAIDKAAGINPKYHGTGLGWQVIIEHTVKTFLESKNLRGMAEALGKLGTVTGYITKQADDDPRGDPAELVRALSDFLRAVREEERRGEVVDVEEAE